MNTLRIDWLAPEFEEHRQGIMRDPNGLEDILAKAGHALADVSVTDILQAFDDLSSSLLERGNPLLATYPASGLPFLARLFQAGRFSNLVADSLGGLECLDGFVPRPHVEGYERRAYARGVVGHWLAGNVPTLGVLSLLSAMMTKNANLVRLPSAAEDLLPELLQYLHGMGEAHARLAAAVVVVRYDYADQATAGACSKMVDTRIIWGGDRSTSEIKALPTKTCCLDVVFPDRTSFVVVGRDHAQGERARTVARLIAHDASVFEQKACASPHTVFLATDSDAILEDFCQLLAEAMAKAVKEIPKQPPSPKESSAILNLRSQYDMFHQAWYPESLEYTVLSDQEVKLGPPIGNRTLFVRKLPECAELAGIIPPNIQSVGLVAEGTEYQHLTSCLGRAGVHRITPLGGMTMFDIPWDGLFIPQFLVRWTTRKTP